MFFLKKTNPWFNASFKFVMCITYSVLSCELAFRFVQFSFFLVKMVTYYEVHVIFQDTEYQLQENILYHFLHYSFLWNLH